MDVDRAHPTQRADQQHPPSFGIEPPGETEKRKTRSDVDRTLQAELTTINMTWNEAKKTAQDWERWRLSVKALCSRGNEEDLVSKTVDKGTLAAVANFEKLTFRA